MKDVQVSAVDEVKICRDILNERKVLSAVILDVRELSSCFDYFLIAVGNSHIHCRSMARELEKHLSKDGFKERGWPDMNSGWIVLDFNEIIVHIFTREVYDYYNLETLWSDASYIE